jgi:hypothetical protein
MSRGYTSRQSLLEETIRWARERNYTGNDYCDGMSSRIRQQLPLENRWLNLVFQESIKRAPVDVRPYLLVELRRNYKGTGLFTMANLNAYRLTGEDRYEAEARKLADWLVDNRCREFSGFCGSHQHEIQHLDGRIGTTDNPDVVSTLYASLALLDASELDPRYAEMALTAADFVLEDLDYHEIDRGARINYTPAHTGRPYTINAVALGARLLLELYEFRRERGTDDLSDRSRYDAEVLRDRATEILDYVTSTQTAEGGWMYMDPPSGSHLSMDNHHNGFIVETLLRYRDVIDPDRYRDTLEDALEFYRGTLFDEDGAPNWDEANTYPRDIHAATQGIITFTRTGDLEFADRIIEWTVNNLHVADGRFYYRKHRFYTKRVTLMRWCQAWMAYAVSEYLMAQVPSRANSVHELHAVE